MRHLNNFTNFTKFSFGSIHSVKSVVDLNRNNLEMEADELDEVQNVIDRDYVLKDAWCELCPEQELECLQCVQERKDNEKVVEEEDGNIPDLAVGREQVSHLEKRNNIM